MKKRFDGKRRDKIVDKRGRVATFASNDSQRTNQSLKKYLLQAKTALIHDKSPVQKNLAPECTPATPDFCSICYLASRSVSKNPSRKQSVLFRPFCWAMPAVDAFALFGHRCHERGACSSFAVGGATSDLRLPAGLLRE